MSLFEALHASPEDLRDKELEPVDVAVIDSGVDATHPELEGRVTAAYRAEMTAGAFELVQGPCPENADLFGHGTAVASIIAGVAPNARVIDIRVLNEMNIGAGDALLKGFEFAVESGIKVINMSLAAHHKFSDRLNALCEQAYLQNQVVVASKRNMPLADNGFPAEFSSCISVDMGNFDSALAVKFRPKHVIEFIGHGEEVSVAAAGGGYTTMTGTSFATPAVSGICALLVGAFPDLHPFDVKSALRAYSG